MYKQTLQINNNKKGNENEEIAHKRAKMKVLRDEFKKSWKQGFLERLNNLKTLQKELCSSDRVEIHPIDIVELSHILSNWAMSDPSDFNIEDIYMLLYDYTQQSYEKIKQQN